MKKRAMVGGAIVIAWVAGLGLLVRREYLRPQLERLTEAATRVAPGAVYYGVMQGDRQVGFASSTIDTAENTISVVDYLVADPRTGSKARRTTARSSVTLSRAMHMSSFELSLHAEGAAVQASGHVEGDSLLVLAIAGSNGRVDSQRVALSGPILLPTIVPLAVALIQRPKAGKHYMLPVMDPAQMSPHNVRLDVRAESLFVVHDSSAYDSVSARWHGVLPDTVRAWRVTADSGDGLNGWVDEHGRIVETKQLGFDLRRMPYEVAFENWRSDSTRFDGADDRDIVETTAIGAYKRMDKHIAALRVRLSGVSLAGFNLNSSRQRFSGDTLIVAAYPESALAASMQLPYRYRDLSASRAEPMIESDNRQIVKLAQRIRAGSRDPRVVAQRINVWVHDSIAARVTFGLPSALQVLRSRRGDCDEHTQLYVALARAIGIPARVAGGLAYVDGKFFYHSWPEVLLKDWVAVDPTFGQFPADAAHLRFVNGGVARHTELLRLMDNLKIDVISVTGASASRSTRSH